MILCKRGGKTWNLEWEEYQTKPGLTLPEVAPLAPQPLSRSKSILLSIAMRSLHNSGRLVVWGATSRDPHHGYVLVSFFLTSVWTDRLEGAPQIIWGGIGLLFGGVTPKGHRFAIGPVTSTSPENRFWAASRISNSTMYWSAGNGKEP